MISEGVEEQGLLLDFQWVSCYFLSFFPSIIPGILSSIDVFLLNLQKIYVYISLVKISSWSLTYSQGRLIIGIGGHMATECHVLLHVPCHVTLPQGVILFIMRGVYSLDCKHTLKP